MLISQTDLVLANGLATPVNVTFSSGGAPDANTRVWYARSVNGGFPLGYFSLKHTVNQPKDLNNPSAMTRQRVHVRLPKLDLSVANNPKLVSAGTASLEVATPANWSDADRQDLLALLASALGLRSTTKLGDNVVSGILAGS